MTEKTRVLHPTSTSNREDTRAGARRIPPPYGIALVDGRPVQAQLSVSAPTDFYEREADRIADQIMRMPAAVTPSERPSPTPLAMTVQRKCSACETDDEPEGVVQRDGEGSPPVSADTSAAIDGLRSNGGIPMTEELRDFFEPRFGRDLSAVRVHTSSNAASAAQALHARAFTLGNDVMFAAGEYQPQTSAGQRLLAHELTHVVQQTNPAGVRSPTIQREPSDAETVQSGPLTHEAKVWIKAFIPGTIAGVTKPVLAGPYSGGTMVDGPTPVSDCFTTDQRGFSSSVGAVARMSHVVNVTDDGSGSFTSSQSKSASPTHEIDCEDGEVECSKSAPTSAMKATVSAVSGGVFGKRAKIEFEDAASNPCFTGAPSIDVGGSVTIDFGARRIDINMLVDSFPAFEMYAKIDDTLVTLFRLSPPPGNTPANLFGGATTGVTGFKLY
jgi:hypothetical protein